MHRHREASTLDGLERIDLNERSANHEGRPSMDKALAPFGPYAYAILRIIAGLLFFCYGGQKLFGWFGGQQVPLGSLFGIAGLLEVILGALITIGLFASYAAFVASGEMAVAYFMAHFPKSFWPLENEGEPAVLFCFIFLYMATQGSGIWSVDAARAERGTEIPIRRV
jgi:putative oxidoreductase